MTLVRYDHAPAMKNRPRARYPSGRLAEECDDKRDEVTLRCGFSVAL